MSKYKTITFQNILYKPHFVLYLVYKQGLLTGGTI